MYEHHIQGMTDAIMKTSLLLGEYVAIAIHDALTDYWKDKLAIVWTTEDVSERLGYSDYYERYNVKATEEDKIAILQMANQHARSSVSITWDDIDDAIENYAEKHDWVCNDEFAADTLANHDVMNPYSPKTDDDCF